MGKLNSINDDHNMAYLAVTVILFYSIIKKNHNDGHEFRDSPELHSGLSLVFEEEKLISNLWGEDVSIRLHNKTPRNFKEQLR